MTAHDEIDARLARVSARLSAQRTSVRERLAKDPALLELADAAREVFGARLTWFKDADGEVGTEPERGIVPAPYRQRRLDETGRTVFLDEPAPERGHAVSEAQRSRHQPPGRRKGKAKAPQAAAPGVRKQQRQVLDALTRWPGSTAVELATRSGLDRYLVSRRLPELVPQYARRGKPRSCTVASTPQTTWYPR